MKNNFFDKMVNMKYFGNSNISLIKALLFFYVIVSVSFTRNLYSGQLIDLLSTNRFMQHLIGLIAMLIIVVEVANITSPIPALLYTTIGYIWFIFTTKLDLHWNLAILGLLVFGFLYESQLFNNELEIKDDESLNEAEKKKIENKNNKIKTLIMIAIIIITLLGILSYYVKKQEQYGSDFDTMKFMFDANKRYKLIK